MTKVFLSPSDQDNNAVDGGGTEQQYAQARCSRAADVLRAHGIDVKVSETGIGDDSNGYVQSVTESNAWGPDLHVADHTNATGNPTVKRSGVQAYIWPGDPASRRLGEAINARMDPIVPGGASIQDGSQLYEVNGTTATAVLMESGYHDNPDDARVIRDQTQAMGEAIAYGILDYLGVTLGSTPAPAPAAPAKPSLPANYPLPYPLPAGHFYGDINGGEDSHGGYYANERPQVRAIQQALIAAGFVPGITDPNNPWADGLYEQATIDAATRFQKAQRPTSTDRWGEMWADDLETLRYNFA